MSFALGRRKAHWIEPGVVMHEIMNSNVRVVLKQGVGEQWVTRENQKMPGGSVQEIRIHDRKVVGLNLAFPRSEEHRPSGSMHELGHVLSQVVIHDLHAVILHNAHQDRLDYLVTKVNTHALPGTQPEPPKRVTVLSREKFAKPVRSEDVSVCAPNRSITVERVGVDEHGSLGRDVVSVDDLGIGSQLWEGVE